ncbi:MAG: ParD-like family protein [Desulfobulbaceae bacterium]|nr:ParD-like family protein [Desulfobulbaceae bacterium]
MVTTVSLRIDQDLVLQAEREAGIQNRSKAKQLEYWAKLGKAVSAELDITDAFAVSQGIKTIRLEIAPSLQSITVDSDAVFNDLERDRAKGILADNVTSAKIYYEASVEHPGYLDRVNSSTGERQTGLFEHGEFKVL